jgi:hypothetical protein
MRLLLLILQTSAALLPLMCLGAEAQTTQNQFWPETDFYYQFKPRVRAVFVVARSQDPGDNDSVELGPDIEVYFKRFVKPPITTNNTASRQLLAFRAGYHYLAGQSPENRGIVQGTARAPILGSMELSDRNRVDLRWVQGQLFSWRYRNRLALQRSFKIKRVRVTPYVDGEFIWSSTTQSWNQNLFDIGANFPFRKWLEVTPYYERNNQNGSPSTHTTASGFIVMP